MYVNFTKPGRLMNSQVAKMFTKIVAGVVHFGLVFLQALAC